MISMTSHPACSLFPMVIGFLAFARLGSEGSPRGHSGVGFTTKGTKALRRAALRDSAVDLEDVDVEKDEVDDDAVCR